MSRTSYITTPIYYANADPHLGHAYTTVVADSLTRFNRQRGVDSFLLTGTDEHGVNIERAAQARGIPVENHVDEIVKRFKRAFDRLGVEYDLWIRTTDPFHEKSVQELWKLLERRGFIYKGDYEGWFCGNCNEFKDVEAGVDNPICPEHDRPLDKVAEESYFFRLSKFQAPLLDLYKTRPDFIRPEARYNEVVSFVSRGLKDLSVSRVTVKWGIPVPGDPAHTIYVWLDALSNYITALGWGNAKYSGFDRYWPGIHLIGKDILIFHTVYWPAFLMAAGIEVPRAVYSHGMWQSGGRRMSKTLGNVIDLDVLHAHFTPDMIRYFMLREKSFGQDGDFTYAALIDRVNSDLADGLGNLASRTLTMVRNYFDSRPPEAVGRSSGEPAEVIRAIDLARRKFGEEFGAFNFSRGIEALWAGIARVDKFITDRQPWKLAKDPSARDRLEEVIAVAFEALTQLAILTAPILPAASFQIWKQMGLPGAPIEENPDASVWGRPLDGIKIGDLSPTFPRLNKEKILADIEKEKGKAIGHEQPESPQLQTGSAAHPAGESTTDVAPEAAVITIDDFAKVELRVATVVEAERVPKADKLLRLLVEIGESRPRQLLAGIAQYYNPEEIIGRKIIVVSNLAPRKLRGLESNGMLLAASVGEEGRPVLATFTEDVPNGARLK